MAFASADYWERRYRRGGNSGAGSRGQLAIFKADVLNAFVADNWIEYVVELGCGDGSQLELARYPRYVGIDVSPTAISICRSRFADDDSKRFLLSTEGSGELKGELALSLDVIFHLVEDHVFEAYMKHLFSLASRFVAIYSSNADGPHPAPHVRHRCFTKWIGENLPDWRLHKHVPNPFPYRESEPETTSFSDFYFYTKHRGVA